MGIAVGLIIIVTSVWVAIDASGRDWRGSSFADRPWKWFVGPLLLWIVVFPVHLAKRNSVPQKA